MDVLAAGQDEFAGLWAEALAVYERRTGRDLQSDPNVQDLKTPEDLSNKISNTDQRFNNFRERHPKLWNTIAAISMPVQAAGGVAQSVLSASQILPACAALGAILYLVQAGKGVSEAYDAIEDLLARIQNATQRFEAYSKADTINQALRKIMIEILCKILEILGRVEKLIQRHRVGHFARSNKGKRRKG